MVKNPKICELTDDNTDTTAYRLTYLTEPGGAVAGSITIPKANTTTVNGRVQIPVNVMTLPNKSTYTTVVVVLSDTYEADPSLKSPAWSRGPVAATDVVML